MTQPPLIILAGFDSRPGILPPEGADKHPLVGAKALDVRVNGVPLIDIVVQRVVASGAFGPVYIAGPARLYGERRGDAEVIDTEGSLGHNIRVALDAMRSRHPGEAVAFSTSDIVPDVAELRDAMARYREAAPLDIWAPMIAVPDDAEALGASAWKPRYRMRPAAGAPPVPTLPSHLVVVHPDVVRVELILRSFDFAYRTRNRPVLYRTAYILVRVFGMLLAEDLRRLLRLRPPAYTVTTLFHSVRLALRLRGGNSTTEELADPVRRIFVYPEHRRRHPERAGRLLILPALSLAKDIDTVEEAEALRNKPPGGGG